MLDYGDLDILTAAEVAVDRYRMLNHAKAFKNEMLNAKHTLEHEHVADGASPPLPAAPAARVRPRAPPPGMPAAATPVAATPEPRSPTRRPRQRDPGRR